MKVSIQGELVNVLFVFGFGENVRGQTGARALKSRQNTGASGSARYGSPIEISERKPGRYLGIAVLTGSGLGRIASSNLAISGEGIRQVSPDCGEQGVAFVWPHVVEPGRPAMFFLLDALALAPGRA